MDLEQVQQLLSYLMVSQGNDVECCLCSNGNYEFGALDECVERAWEHLTAYHPALLNSRGLRLDHVSPAEEQEAIASIKKVTRG